MSEPAIVVEHREHLWYLLAEAAQVEHMIMCQYLYASYSLKTEPDEGLSAGQASAVAGWQKMLAGIAVEEMLHLALVCNVMCAIGAAPPLGRPNFPRDSDHLPPGASTVEIRLIADRGGTRVELEHRDLPPSERPGHISGWTHYLARLEAAAAGRDPGPDPGMPDPAQAEDFT